MLKPAKEVLQTCTSDEHVIRIGFTVDTNEWDESNWHPGAANL